VWAFDAMGSRAVPVLVKAMNDPNPGVHGGVLSSLAKIGAPAVPELVRLLQSDQIDLRRNAAWALAWLRQSDAAAAAALVNALNSPDDELREAALFALGQTHTASAVSAIREALHDKNERVRREAQMALQALDPSFNDVSRDLPQQVGEVGRFIGHTATVTRVAFLPDGRRAISAERDGAAVRLWDIATAKQIRCLNIDNARQACALSTDGQWVACGGMYQRLRLMNFESGDEKRHFVDQGGLILLAIRPQVDRVVSVNMPQIVGPPFILHVWDVASGKETRSFRLPLSSVTRLAFSADGRRLVWRRDFDHWH